MNSVAEWILILHVCYFFFCEILSKEENTACTDDLWFVPFHELHLKSCGTFCVSQTIAIYMV